MISKQNVCSLALATKLKKLGVKQESPFHWESWRDSVNFPDEPLRWDLAYHPDGETYGNDDFCSAFTASELIEMLPARIVYKKKVYWLVIIKEFPNCYFVRYVKESSQTDLLLPVLCDFNCDDNLCNPLAETYIFLLKKKIVVL